MQTDHATVKCTLIGRIACAAKAILPNNKAKYKDEKLMFLVLEQL